MTTVVSAEFTRAIAGREVVARCHPALERHAHWLLGVFDELDREGKDVWGGQRIEVGWSLLTLWREGERWIVHEPNFAGDPFRGTRGDVTTSLSVQAQQNDVVKRVGVEPVKVSFQDHILIGEGCLDAPDVYLQRHEPPTPSHSGWYLGPVNGDVEERENFYVYELLKRRQAVLQVLALPPGYLAVFERDRIKAVLNSADEDLWTRH